ncbi:MAG: CehA/McbA family metallohydrolase, partial [Deltaproteobacteria bacterium]|nr:CehA/McbA family metallohydrolase [Deltaproteobacteria bacterium]
TGADGAFALHVPAAADVRLDAYTTGEAITSVDAGTGATADIAMPPLGKVHVTATEQGAPVPVRVQVFPTGGRAADGVPNNYGEPELLGGRQLVRFATSGDLTVDVPPGTWRVVVSRGYEYELVEETVTVAAGATATVDAAMDRSVDTRDVQCADFHVHTWRSNDSGDDALDKLAQAVADGLELPVRSDHEYVADFSSEIERLGVGAFANGMGSIELTSFEVWGHMGVFPLVPDPAAVNGGAPRWQVWPTPEDPDVEMATLSPPAVFDEVRRRPEQPVVIINHPRGGKNYFEYVGLDPATGIASQAPEFDTKFTLVEVFNDSGWLSNRNGNVRDWFNLLRAGRKIFAVGSSDSHGLVTSPVGYPRTCLTVGTDDPRLVTPNLVRDRLAQGRSAVSGGIYVSARIGTAGPGETTRGAGAPIDVDVTVRAATWVDVDSIDVVVDGMTVDTIPIMPGDADPSDATIRYAKRIQVQTAATGGFVVIAAYGNRPLEPVHPGRAPFGVTNPIFVEP